MSAREVVRALVMETEASRGVCDVYEFFRDIPHKLFDVKVRKGPVCSMSEEKKIKQNKKIESFDILPEDIMDPEMDELLRKELMQEADALEAKLNSDPELVGVGASDDLFASIVGKLKDQGVWEEEEENSSSEESISETAELSEEADSVQEEIPEKVRTDELEKLYKMMPEEDRRALELGRQVQEKAGKKKKRRKVYRFAGAAAAMLVLVSGVGMSTEANRKVALQAWNAVMENFGFRTYTDSVDNTFVARSKSEEEIKAYEEISEKLGIAGIDFVYLPDDMRFLGYDISSSLWEATLFYSYKDSIVSFGIVNTSKEGVSYYSLDSQTKKCRTIISKQKVEMEIWETNLNAGEDIPISYIGKAEHNGYRCIINAQIPLEEMKKIMENMFFS